MVSDGEVELYVADAITVITCDGRIIVVGPLRKRVYTSGARRLPCTLPWSLKPLCARYTCGAGHSKGLGSDDKPYNGRLSGESIFKQGAGRVTCPASQDGMCTCGCLASG